MACRRCAFAKSGPPPAGGDGEELIDRPLLHKGACQKIKEEKSEAGGAQGLTGHGWHGRQFSAHGWQRERRQCSRRRQLFGCQAFFQSLLCLRLLERRLGSRLCRCRLPTGLIKTDAWMGYKQKIGHRGVFLGQKIWGVFLDHRGDRCGAGVLKC